MKRNVIEFTRATDSPQADFSHLRGEAVLGKLLRRHPDDERCLKRAHELLGDDPHYATAMHRVAYSLHEGFVRAFISYRADLDAAAARTVAETFRRLSRGRVDVTFADEFTERISGRDYKSEIEEATKRSQWFVLLVSGTRELSGWCMYETGLFRASATSRKLERLICLHHPGAALPGAVDGFQAVPGDVEHLVRFLDGLFRQPDPLPGWDALNPDLDDDTIRQAASGIAQALRPPRQPVAFHPGVTLVVPGGEALADAERLDACTIETDRLTARLFGKAETPRTWGALVAPLRSAGTATPWLDELLVVLRKAAAGNVFRPLGTSFESAQAGRMVRPVLHAMERDGPAGELRFHLYFLDDFSSPLRPGIAPRTGVLLTALRQHHRVRWEVVERFDACDWHEDDFTACAKALSRIDREAQAHGGVDLAHAGEPAEGRGATELRELAEDWAELCAPPQGALLVALRARDARAVRPALARCRALNRRYLELLLPILEDLTSREA